MSRQPEGNGTRRRRLSDEASFDPWVKAEDLLDVSLFWLGTSGFPLRHAEQVWILRFLERLDAKLKADHGLRAEIFFQWKKLDDEHLKQFQRHAASFMSIMGLSRKPGANIPDLPSTEYLRGLLKSGEEFKLGEWTADYAYWFATKNAAKQRELFLGQGGMTTVYLPPDPKTTPPPLPMTPRLKAVFEGGQNGTSIDGLMEGSYALSDSFLKKSKEVFGAGLEEESQYRGLAFILPLLESAHFFAASAEERGAWLDVFPVYLNESATDNGLVLGCKPEFEPAFLQVVQSMQEDGPVYEIIAQGERSRL